jgi:hypothetical protein
MLITRVGDEPIENVSDLEQALRDASFEEGVFVEALTPRLRGEPQGRQLFLLKRR